MSWLVFALLLLAACGFLLLPLWTCRASAGPGDAPADRDTDIERANTALYREKLAELERQRRAGEIGDSQYLELELEAKKQLLTDTDTVLNTSTAGVRSPAAGRKTGAVLIAFATLVVPVAAVLLYQTLGADDEVALTSLLAERERLFTTENVTREQQTAIEQRLQDSLLRLADKHRDQPVYRIMLARQYQDQGNFPEAVVHLRQVLAAAPAQPVLMAEYAQALFFASGNRVTPEVQSTMDRVLVLDPDNATVLGLQGIARYQGGDFHSAIDFWQKALANTPPMSPGADALRAGIANAREQLGAGEKQGESPASSSQSVPGATAVAMTLEVSLDDGFSVPPQTPVFVYAREWQGSPMPLAIQRLTVADLPASVVLDETMAMTPARTLATVERVELVARVALSGAAAPAPGDIEGRAGPFSPGEAHKPIPLAINRQVQ